MKQLPSVYSFDMVTLYGSSCNRLGVPDTFGGRAGFDMDTG